MLWGTNRVGGRDSTCPEASAGLRPTGGPRRESATCPPSDVRGHGGGCVAGVPDAGPGRSASTDVMSADPSAFMGLYYRRDNTVPVLTIRETEWKNGMHLAQVYEEHFERAYACCFSICDPWSTASRLCVTVLPGSDVESAANEYLLAFSCKRRYFCPSCEQKRVVKFSEGSAGPEAVIAIQMFGDFLGFHLHCRKFCAAGLNRRG